MKLTESIDYEVANIGTGFPRIISISTTNLSRFISDILVERSVRHNRNQNIVCYNNNKLSLNISAFTLLEKANAFNTELFIIEELEKSIKVPLMPTVYSDNRNIHYFFEDVYRNEISF